MNVPSGYSALDLVGFTDKGDYSPSATYVKNDLVHYNGAIWKCLIDDTTGIVPTTGVNWDIWIDQSTSLDGLTDVEITSPTDGQEITYDGTTQKWKNTSKIQTLTNQVKDMNNVYGAKNLLPNNAPSQVKYGVTFTVNDDGTITANGTAENNTNTTATVTLPAGNYILSGCPSGGSGNKYRIAINNRDTSTNLGFDYGSGFEFTLNEETNLIVHFDIRNGYTANNLTFKPMIRLASITDDTYEPYAKTNQQLTQDTTALFDNTEVNGAVNMLPINLTTQVDGIYSYTVAADKTISTVVSSTTSLTLKVISPVFTLKAGTYKLSGTPVMSGPTADLQLLYSDESAVIATEANNQGVVFTLSTDASVKLRIIWHSNVVAGTYVFKPMITVASYDGDYVPYAKSNKELTENLNKGQILEDFIGTGDNGISVTGDGVKTLGTLLNELGTALLAKAQSLASNEYMEIRGLRVDGSWEVPINQYQIFDRNSAKVACDFGTSALNYGNTGVYVHRTTVSSVANEIYANVATIKSSGVTFSTDKENVIGNGKIVKMFYRIYKRV